MSQQEMQFEHTRHSGSASYDSGYEALPPYSDDFEAGSYQSKIRGQAAEDTDPESAHLTMHRLNLRIGMAITSLALWMIFFFGAIAIILNNPTVIVIQALLFVGLGVFTLLVILANILINRKRI